MTTDLATTSNSVLDRFKGAERNTQYVVLAAAGVLAYVFSAPLLAFVERLRALAENTLYLGIEVGVGVLVLYMLSDPKFRNLFRSIYRMGIRALTSLVIRMDPIGIAEDRVRDLKKSIQKFQDQLAKLLGQITSLAKEIEENNQIIKETQGQLEYLTKHKRTGEAAFKVAVSRDKSTRESNERLGKLLGRLKRAHLLLGKLKEVADSVCQVTEEKVNLAKREEKASKAAFGALKSAMAVIRDNSSGKEAYDQAMEILGDDFEYRMGAIDEFTKSCDGLIQTIAMNDEIAAEEAIKNLETMQTRMLGSETPNVIDVSAMVVPSSTRQPVLVSEGSTALFLDDETNPPRR